MSENFIDKIKKKLRSESGVNASFTYAADDIQKMLHYLAASIEAFCNNDDKLLEEKAVETLKTELRLQAAHEKIIDKMYSRETMNFSREDLHNIVNKLIEISDDADFIVRRIRAYHPRIHEDLAVILLKCSADIRKFGDLLEKIVNGLLEDFHKVKELTMETHRLERSMWKYEIDFLKNVYQIGSDASDVIYYEMLMRSIRMMIMRAVRFTDLARKLVIKYTF